MFWMLASKGLISMVRRSMLDSVQRCSKEQMVVKQQSCITLQQQAMFLLDKMVPKCWTSHCLELIDLLQVCILNLSHERLDVQHTVKCLASYLSSPTKHAWTHLGRLIGYLQRTAGSGVQTQCTQPGMSLFEKLADSDKQNSNCSCLVESFADSASQGGKDLRSTSSAAHYVNGHLIHSSSRTQHVVSLSSTEAECSAMTSTCIDTIYVKHSLATRQIANKLGTSKLRHVQKKLVCVQSQVKSGVFTLKQIPTMWNPADLGTKGLNRRRHNMLLYLFGFVDEKGDRVGELDCREHKLQEASKSTIKRVKHKLPEDGPAFSSASSSKTAKQVLRLAMMQVVGALSQKAEPNALVKLGSADDQKFSMNFLLMICFAMVVIALMAIMI